MSLLNWLRKGQSLVNTDQTSKKDRRGIIAASVEVQNAQCEKNTFQKRRGQYQQLHGTEVLTHPFTIAVCDWSKCHHVRTRIKRSQASLGSNVKVVTSQIKFNGNDV